MKLGKLQLRQLMGLAMPGMLLVVGDGRVPQSLVRRSLLASRDPENPSAFLGITPKGMRVLADAFEAGELEQFMKPFPPKSRTIADVFAERNELVDGMPHVKSDEAA